MNTRAGSSKEVKLTISLKLTDTGLHNTLMTEQITDKNTKEIFSKVEANEEVYIKAFEVYIDHYLPVYCPDRV